MNNIKLTQFDLDFFKSIPDGEKIDLNLEKGIYYTIVTNDNRNIGVIGYIPTTETKDEGFIQIVLVSDMRGKGISRQAMNLLVAKDNLKKLHASVKRSDISSIKTLERYGFKRVSSEREKYLKKVGVLKDDEHRYVKDFTLSTSDLSTKRATVEELRTILSYMSKGYSVPQIVYDIVLQVAKKEVEEKHKVVLMKRDPNIHNRRIQGAFVKITESKTVDIHPAQVGGFGADFDGDTMSLYAPLSEESQSEIRKKMISAVNTSSINSPNFQLSKEMLTGIYTLTYRINDKTPKKINTIAEAETLHIWDPIEIKTKSGTMKTTAGRFIFNYPLNKFGYPYVNEAVDKKKLNQILSDLIKIDKNTYATTLDQIMNMGLEYATKYPRTISLDMLTIPQSLLNLKEKLEKSDTIEEQEEIITQMETVLLEHLKKNVPDLYEHVMSGASSGISQLRQVMVAKGLIADAEGNLLPAISKAMNDGYSPSEYFNAAAGSRKGIIDRAINTASGGYEYRKFIYIVGDVVYQENNVNCGTKRFLNIKLTKELYQRLKGRYVQVSTNNVVPINENMIGKKINLRSPVFCKTKPICKICYGDLINQLDTKNIGIVAAQEVGSLSEKIMKCSDGLVHVDGMMIPFEDFYNNYGSSTDEIKFSNTSVKNFVQYVEDYNAPVKFHQIEKHKPTDKMLYIITEHGFTLFCQKNHPVWVRNRTGDSQVIDMLEKESIHLTTNDELWVDGSKSKNVIGYLPKISPQNYSSDIVESIKRNGYKSDLNKRLPYNFISFDNDWLKSFLINLTEDMLNSSMGSICSNQKTYILDFGKEFYLQQQVKSICEKLSIYNIPNIYVKNNDVHFLMEIDFEKDSVLYRGFDKIVKIVELPEWNKDVYDIKTDSMRYMLSMVCNHNSFHTGGAVDMQKIDIFREFMRNIDDPKIEIMLKTNLKQVGSFVETNVNDISIQINKSLYTSDKYQIEREDEYILLPLGYFTLFINNQEIDTTIEQKIKILSLNKDIEENDQFITIKFNKGDKVFQIVPTTVDVVKLTNRLDDLVSGKSPWTTVESLYFKFFEELKGMGNWDSVHLEVILSNIIRNKKNVQSPARLVEPYDPELISIKSLPGEINWTLGLAFENMGKSIQKGLISTRVKPTPIEKILFGETLS